MVPHPLWLQLRRVSCFGIRHFFCFGIYVSRNWGPYRVSIIQLPGARFAAHGIFEQFVTVTKCLKSLFLEKLLKKAQD